MNSAAICPDDQTLENLLRGLVSEDEALRLEQHLLDCARCCQATGEIEVNDTLLDALRQVAGAADLPRDEIVREMMLRLKELRRPIATVIDETMAARSAPTEDAWGLEKLLDPPEAEGELGRFAGYRVLRVLGAGGMGLVLEAEDPKLRRRVAMKVMKRGLAAGDENQQRFLREARAAAAIEHPHIVTVYQVGEHNGMPFMVMPLLKGEALDERLRRAEGPEVREGSVGNALRGVPGSGVRLQASGKRVDDSLALPAAQGSRASLPLAECLRIGRETAEALAEAHQRGLIHRDVKPGNIWLEGAGGWVKLVDFGLAHAAEDVHLTQTGAILGTPAYMSPEQARGEATDGRTDLYSLGAVLYRLTTGDVPFRGASTMAVLMALATETPKPPREINPDLPPELSDLIVRLLAKKPDDRFESASAVADAIRQIEASRVGIAHHEPDGGQCPPYASKPCPGGGRTRRRWPLVAAAAAAFVLLAGIVIIVRDKDGNEMARVDVPDGNSVTVSSSERASKASGTRERPGNTDSPNAGKPVLHANHREADTSRSPAAANVPPPIEVPEPPPLEEWLKGRTELTVSQDGKGQFKTIQAALNALKPGQVVRVLDRGPYREGLNVHPPAKTGLLSDVDTVIELPAITDGWADSEIRGHSHVFNKADGFRLSGFIFPRVEAKRYGSYHSTVYFWDSGSVVIEKCLLEQAVSGNVDVNLWALHLNWPRSGRRPDACFVQDSIFEGRMMSVVPLLTVQRNWFRGENQNAPVTIASREHEKIVVRHNVMDAGVSDGVKLYDTEGTENIEVSNNTFVKGGLLASRVKDDLSMGVTLRGNLFGGPILFSDKALFQLPDAIRQWQVGQNGYPYRAHGQYVLPPRDADMIRGAAYLSTDRSNRDYLRLAANSPLATGGPGGAWPEYIGALPPGPAPKEGDWFTRLQERWRASKIGPAAPAASPPQSFGTTLPEPPPLEEWLKGRTELTVSQDGKGRFKTIQAALGALKPGQVVRVLDRGPYREAITLTGPPDDVGLVSNQQTVIDLSNPERKDAFHVFGASRFRLHGFTIVFMDASQAPLKFGNCGNVVIDRCVVRNAAADLSPLDAKAGFALNVFRWGGKRGAPGTVCLRESVIDGQIQMSESGENVSTLLARNYLTCRGLLPDNSLGSFRGGPGPLAVRENVVDARTRFELSLQPAASLTLTRNTILSPTNQFPIKERLPKTATIVNNIFEAGFELPASPDGLPAWKTWKLGPNAYLSDPKKYELPRQSHDVQSPPRFLSEDFSHRDFARPLPDSVFATAGAGGDLPKYLGALPPGPAPKEGDWFTRLQDRWRASKVGPAIQDGAPAMPAAPSPRSVGAAVDAEKPFVVLRGGKEAARFKHWAATQAELRADDEIEVHGNGPFRLPLVRLNGIGLKIKAAPGYQPTFVSDGSGDPADKGGWILVVNGPIVLEGCEFRQPANFTRAMLKGWPDSVQIRRCRLIGGHCHGNGTMLDLVCRSWKVTDSFLHFPYGFSVCNASGAEQLVFENNIVAHLNDRLLAAPPDQATYKLRLSSNTLFGWFLNAGRSVIAAERNLLAGQGRMVHWSSDSNEALRDWCQWTGRDNVFVLPGGKSPEEALFWPKPVSPEDQATARDVCKDSLTTSRTALWPDVPWQAPNAEHLRPWITAGRLNLSRPKGAKAAPTIGPDWRLVGTGEAYLAALAEQGQAVDGDALRPDDLGDGAVALVSPGREPRSFANIAQAIDAAHDGDTVELRSDGEFDGVNRREEAQGKRLTLRAAPGYCPTVRGALRLAAADAWSIEGLRFNAFVDVPHLVEKHDALPNGRMLNCSFGPLSGGEAKLAVSGFKADAPAYEIIGCVMPQDLSFSAREVSVRHSALSTILAPRAGAADVAQRALRLERCVLFALTPVLAPILIRAQPPLAVDARGTWFECFGCLVEHAGELRWQGSGNAFCEAGFEWEYDLRPGGQQWVGFGLSAWQARHSTDLDSWSGDSWILDPRAWRLTDKTPGYRAGPDGQDLGANVDRIPGPSGVDLTGVGRR